MTEFEPDLLLTVHDVARLARVIIDKRARMHDMTRAQWVMMLWFERKPGITQRIKAVRMTGMIDSVTRLHVRRRNHAGNPTTLARKRPSHIS